MRRRRAASEGVAATILFLGRKEARLTIRAGHANAFEASGAGLDVALDGHALGYLKAFVLTAVRDGLASVDHVDINLSGTDPAAPTATLTLVIPQTAR